MTVSYVVGRSGMLDDETGLFVLEGYDEHFTMPPNTLSLLQGERKLAEFNSQVPFKDGVPGPDFLNKRPGWFANMDLRERFLEAMIPGTDLLQLRDSMYTVHNTRKIAPRKYVNQFSGVVGDKPRLKVILRQQGVGTKRVALFYPGVPRSRGGRTWIMSPHGFGAATMTREIWLDTTGYTQDHLAACGCDLENKFLWMAITNAVPFISNSPVRCRDENTSRFLMSDLDDRVHRGEVLKYEEKVLDFGGAYKMLIDMLKNGKPGPAKASFKTKLSVDVDDSLFCVRELLNG